MGYHPLGALHRIDRRAMHRQVQGLLDRLGVQLASDRPVRGLSIADQQIVEIAKALSFDARVLIMDEPTAALSGPEVERLFAVVRNAAGAGRRRAVHLAPPRGDHRDLRHRDGDARRRRRARRADRRDDARRHGPADGRARARRAVPQAGGGDRRAGARRSTGSPARACSSTSASTSAPARSSRSPGLVGAGRSEVARAIFGIDRADAGHVEMGGVPPAGRPPDGRDARRHRVRAGGPAHAGPGDGPVDRPQRDADAHEGAHAARADPGRRGEPPRARVGRAAAAAASTASRTRSASSPAATSRRSCSPSGWPPSRSC